MRELRRIRLRDLPFLTPEQLGTARNVCARLRDAVASRPAVIARLGVGPEIALPAANWSEQADNAIHNLFHHVVRCDPDVVARLRLFTQPFTGYELARMRSGTGKTQIPEVGPDFDDRLEEQARRPDAAVERLAAIQEQLPPEAVITYPRMLGEIGWELDGRPANHDVFVYQERVALLHEAGVLDWLRERARRPQGVTLIEVGGGYGGLAYGLMSLIPGTVRYVICDLPESLLFAHLYLALTRPGESHRLHEAGTPSFSTTRPRGFTYVPNYLLDDLSLGDGSVDLAINTLSLAEMSAAQVRYYAERISRLIGENGLFFEQNHPVDFARVKDVLPAFFRHRTRASSRLIPAITVGEADFWSNRELGGDLDSPRPGWARRVQLAAWRTRWLVRQPAWGGSRLRQALKASVPPRFYGMLKTSWNRLRGTREQASHLQQP